MNSSKKISVFIDNNKLRTYMEALSNIRLSDAPIIGIIVLHFIIFLTAFKYRTNLCITSVIFIGCFLGIVFTEDINHYCSQNYEQLWFSFNYFDTRLLFITVFWVIPLTLDLIIFIIELIVDINGSISVTHDFKELIEKKE